jgi:hypothetical protein
VTFQPYLGEDRLRVKRQPGWQRTDRHEGDQSGTVVYEFNSLGFRGQEFDPDAKLKIFVFGESQAFGTGLPLADTWPSQVAHRIADKVGIESSQVCVMNFAEPGISNAAIARSVITQCEGVRPDFVLVQFAYVDRCEVLVDGLPSRVGTWLLDEGAQQQLGDLPPGDFREHVKRRLARSKAYFDFADAETWVLDSVKDILLVQYYLASKSIDGFAVCDGSRHIFEKRWIEHPVNGPLISQINRTFLSGLSLDSLAKPEDLAADGSHLGAAAHTRLANAAFALFQDLEFRI